MIIDEQTGTANQTFLTGIMEYVGFTADSSAALRAFHPLAAPRFTAIVDDFYATIERYPAARDVITGGAPQIHRLKETLHRWLGTLLLGPHDQTYLAARARIGRMHVRINLPQAYMFTAMNRIRTQLLSLARQSLASQPARQESTCQALDQILDLELAIMLETYREALAQANRASERLATIGQFAASIGHELRNPLGVMESSLYLLDKHLGPAIAGQPNVRKHLDRIGTEVRRSTKTIHDLLDLARRRPPQKLATPVDAIVASAVDAALLPEGMTVDRRIADDAATIEADPDQLRQVLSNLLTNAQQAGARRIVVESRKAINEIAMRVSDDGPGIPVPDRSRVFEALYTTKAKGSGLGLALCRQVVEAHGGTISLEPTDRGASFLMRFPDHSSH